MTRRRTPEMYLWTRKLQFTFGTHPNLDPDQVILFGIFATVGQIHSILKPENLVQMRPQLLEPSST